MRQRHDIADIVSARIRKLHLSSDIHSGAGAILLETVVTHLVTTGANALTLADGEEGQIKIIVMRTDGGAGTLTPTNLGDGTTLTFDDDGDYAILQFTGTDWWIIAATATLA